MQVLSPAASPPYAEKEADAVAAARLINDSYAELAAEVPGPVRGRRVAAAAPHRRRAARDGARAGPARHARRVDDLLLLRPLHRGGGVRAALRGDEPARHGAELPPDPERHLLAHDQRLPVHGLRGRLAGGQRHRPAPDRPARAGALPEHQVRHPPRGRHHPDAAPAARQPGPAPAPGPAGAPRARPPAASTTTP